MAARGGIHMGRSVLPVGELLHPLPLAAVLVLALNDHVLKGAGWLPGWLTGKLSDVAGVFFFPLLLTALVRTIGWLAHGRRVPLSGRLLFGAVLATALAFAAVKLVPAAAEAWVWLVPRLDPTRSIDHVRVVRDPTDLLVLPVLALTWWHGRRVAARDDAFETPREPENGGGRGGT